MDGGIRVSPQGGSMDNRAMALLGLGAVAVMAYAFVRQRGWTVQGEVGRTEVFPVDKNSLKNVQGLAYD